MFAIVKVTPARAVHATQELEVVRIAVRAVQPMLAPEAHATPVREVVTTTVRVVPPTTAQAVQPIRGQLGRNIMVLVARPMTAPADRLTQDPAVHVMRVLAGPAIQGRAGPPNARASATEGLLARRGTARVATSSKRGTKSKLRLLGQVGSGAFNLKNRRDCISAMRSAGR